MFTRLSIITTLLAFVIIIVGSYVRLSDAGLGCPDWPGCYGKMIVPDQDTASQDYPTSYFNKTKAWKEMLHRYLVPLLGICVLILAVWSLKWRKKSQGYQRHSLRSLVAGYWALAVLLILQALLGMWTVTLKLHPLVVMSHLVGGLTVLGLLWWLTLRQGKFFVPKKVNLLSLKMKPWAVVGLVILIIQIVLGGWTSANYASLACLDFPTCQGDWLPPFNLKEAFFAWHDFGASYEGGVLSHEARMTIHWIHRLWGLFTFVYFLGLAIRTIHVNRKIAAPIKKVCLFLGLIVSVQFSLGLLNIFLILPLPIAVAHTAGAALLLLTLLTLIYLLKPARLAFYENI